MCGAAWSQQTNAPQPNELPPIEVTTKAKPKPAKAKAAKKPEAAANVVQQSAGTTPAGSASSDGQGTKPGLNLDAPASTGSRLNLTPLETPASVQVIPGEAIRERGQQSVSDAVTQNAAGFTSLAAPGNGGTSLAARGFAGHGSVMQLYDGTRLYVGSGTVTFPFDTWSAERIEVLRGPASVMYGEGAIGGAVNVVPKKPTDYFTGEAEVGIGTDGLKRFGVGAGGPINERLSYRFDASGIQSDGWLDRQGDFDSVAVSGALKYKATSDLSFTLSHDSGNQSPLRYFGTPLVNGGIADGTRFKSFNVDDSEVRYRDNWTQFKTEWTPSDAFAVRNTVYRLTSDRHWRNVESYTYQPATGKVRLTDYLEIYHDQEQVGNRFDATVRANLGGGVKNELVAGFDVNRIEFRHTNNSPYNTTGTHIVDLFDPEPGFFDHTSPTIPGFESETSQYSLFAEDRLELSKQFSVVAGIRLDRPTIDRTDLRNPAASFEKEFSDVTWRAGAVYTLAPGLAFYGQYATAVDPVGGLITLNQSGSQWELATGRQIEIGVKQEFWRGRGEWTLAGYDIEKKNILSRDPDDPTITRQIGQQSSRGIEASLALQLTDTLRYEGNAAILEAQYDVFRSAAGVDFAGNRPTNVPEQLANSWLTWAFLPKWEARAGVQWVGSMYGDDANKLKRPDYTVVNLGLDYDVTDKSKVALRVYNVFDEMYALSGGSTEWQLAPPRSAELSYRIKY
jgi:iron complex outermembrane receptor protein